MLVNSFIVRATTSTAVCMITPSQTYYYHFDGLGSVVLISDNDAQPRSKSMTMMSMVNAISMEQTWAIPTASPATAWTLRQACTSPTLATIIQPSAGSCKPTRPGMATVSTGICTVAIIPLCLWIHRDYVKEEEPNYNNVMGCVLGIYRKQGNRSHGYPQCQCLQLMTDELLCFKMLVTVLRQLLIMLLYWGI